MLFTLIRHAKSKVDPEVPITLWGLILDGIESADRLAQQEGIKNLDVIYSSYQTKAIETMLHLAQPNCLPMRAHEGLAEISSFTKKFYGGQQYEDNIRDFYADSLARTEDGATIEEALTRFKAALDAIANSNSDKQNVGIVTHGYVLSFFTARYTNTSALDWHHTIAMPDVAVFDWSSKSFVRLWSGK